MTGNKRKQIIQVVQYLDERLKELDEEKEELRKYQQLDKQRKSLEYAIYSKEVQDAQIKLTEVIYVRMLLHNFLHDFLLCFISWISFFLEDWDRQSHSFW